MIDAREIVGMAGMSSRPEFYSGRGATTSDLNHKHLTKIATLAEQFFGADARSGFVDMVEALPKLSATDFLLNLYRLEAKSWKWEGEGINVNAIYPGDIGSAFGTIASVMGGMNERDETATIRGQFLRDNGRKVSCHSGRFYDAYGMRG